MVFNNVFPGLCRFLESLLGGHAAAQDIAQETFIRFYRAGDIPSHEARFWLFRVARNLALNELGRRQTRTRLLGELARALWSRPSDPEEEFARDERDKLVRRLLDSLPEHQRAALILREQNEMSYSEIARVLEISESKVKTDIFRARNSLRSMWNEAQSAPSKRRYK